jgi:hypothetical protein
MAPKKKVEEVAPPAQEEEVTEVSPPVQVFHF